MVVRRAWRSYAAGAYEGDTDDEAEELADDRAKRQRRSPAHTDEEAGTAAEATLLPRSGPRLTVVSTADLHRHHDERYIKDDTLSLAEWFESDESPSHVDLCLFAGDLGLEMRCESTSVAQSWHEMGHDAGVLDSWRTLLRRMLNAKPAMHVVIVGGNHDGLLCADDKCLACDYWRRDPSGRRGDTSEVEHSIGHGLRPPEAFAARVGRMLEGLPRERVHVLCDTHVDVHLVASGEVVRVVGSPWTTYVVTKEHLSISHHWRPQNGFIFGGRNLQLPEERRDWAEWWRDHWSVIGDLLEGESTASGEPISASVLVTHTPPHGVLDIVGGTQDSAARLYGKGGAVRGRRVGDPALQKMLEGLRRPPLLHVFGHVHAKQSVDEPDEGPRLSASKRVPGCLFANVAAERSLPEITGHRLQAQRARADLASGATMALPPPGASQSTAIMPALTEDEWRLKDESADQAGHRRLLMRPPAVLKLPLRGYACDVASWSALWSSAPEGAVSSRDALALH